MDNETFEKVAAGDLGAPQGTKSDIEPDSSAGQSRLADARFDPCILFSEIKARDWRMDCPTPAEGINHAAVVSGGEVLFFEPVPQGQHSNFAGDQGGAKTPYPVQLVRMGIEMLTPPTRTFLRQYPTDGDPWDELFPSHAQMLATILTRGLFYLELADVPILKAVPVSEIGAGGGVYHMGDSFGSAQNQQPQWSNAFKLPDDLVMDPQANTALKASIKLNPADIAMLGKWTDDRTAVPGWGQPFAKQPKIEESLSEANGLVQSLLLIAVPYFGVRLHFWGRRGLNIRAGRSSLIKATANRR